MITIGCFGLVGDSRIRRLGLIHSRSATRNGLPALVPGQSAYPQVTTKKAGNVSLRFAVYTGNLLSIASISTKPPSEDKCQDDQHQDD
jgi:hypothetical protein